jgi:hypothetical protein
MDAWTFANEYAVGICVVLCIVCLVFICYGHRHREEVQLVLKNTFFTMPESPIDWWSVSHMILYAIFGFLIPEKPLTFFCIGAAFEVVKDALSSKNTTQLADCTNPRNDDNLMCKFSIGDDYWYMNSSDMYVNLLGYILGSATRTCLFK